MNSETIISNQLPKPTLVSSLRRSMLGAHTILFFALFGIALWMMVFVGVAQAATRTLYVAPTGNDANPGTLAAPFRTAQWAVRQAQAGDTIQLRAGTYNEVIVFDHGGTAGNPITLQNYPGEVAILDGSMDVTGWTQIIGTNVWKASFTHPQGTTTQSDFEDAAPVATCADSFQYAGDRQAYLYVDDQPDSAHWLKPVCVIGPSPESAVATLPAGAFATDVPPPPLAGGQHYAGTTNTVYVHLSDNSNPNTHRIRIPAFNFGIKLRGDGAAQASHVNIVGLTLRGAQTSILIGSHYPNVTSNITLDRLDISLNNGWAVGSYYCATNVNITNNRIHDIQYEGIHLQSDQGLVDSNLVEHTIAPWSTWASTGINVLGVNNRILRNTVGNMDAFGIFMEQWYNTTGDIGCRSESNQYNLVEKNRIYNNGAGIANSGGDYNTIQNNLIYGNKSSGVTMDAGGMGGGPSGTQRNATANKIYYNTVYGNGDYGIDLQASAIETTVRNNIVYKSAMAENFHYHPEVITYQDHNFLADPLFVNPTTGDFHLRTGSPVINGGINVGVADDYDGQARPQGAVYDAGAYQYQTAFIIPTAIPSVAPTQTSIPSFTPTRTAVPSVAPTQTSIPSLTPTRTAVPSVAPTQTAIPSVAPTQTSIPSFTPTRTAIPSVAPTQTLVPSLTPTQMPVASPTATNASGTRISLASVSTGDNAKGQNFIIIKAPAKVAIGDVMIAQIVVRGTTTVIRPPGGWILIRKDTSTASIGSALYYKVVTKSEPSYYSWRFDISQQASGGIAAYKGVNNTAPIDASSNQYGYSRTAITAPSVNITAANDQLVFFATVSINTSVTPPSEMTQRWSVGTTDTLSLMADQPLSAIGATGNRVGASGNSSSSNIGQLVTLKPATR